MLVILTVCSCIGHERTLAFHPKMFSSFRPYNPNDNLFHHKKRSLILLNMGLFDFLRSRDGDFVKLETTESFGPGPLLLLYNAPSSIVDGEIMDMIHDGAPLANKNGVKLCRIYPNDLDSTLGERTVQSILSQANQDGFRNENHVIPYDKTRTVPILYFSGFSNSEMMATYNIIAQEIYMESNGLANAACAKAVAPAMGKSFRQLLDEITRDHLQAIGYE